MANTENIIITGKGDLLHDCKTFGKKSDAINPRCKACAKKYAPQHSTCLAIIAAAASKPKTENKPARVIGFWGYARGSYTDIFCNAICEKPLTMNQAAAIIAPDGQPIGPHPKCKRRLIAEGLAVFDNHQIYMRVWPKGHPEQGKLTPAAKLYREMQSKKTENKKAA